MISAMSGRRSWTTYTPTTQFRDTNVPIYVHKKELKYALYSVATKTDARTYQLEDLDFGLNWQAFHGEVFELTAGVTPRHVPGLAIFAG